MDSRGLHLSLIVLTHGHMDHIECLADLAARTGAEVTIHALDALMLSDPTLSGATLFGYSQAPTTPGRLLSDGDEVSLPDADLKFTVLHTPGHTPGSICLLAPNVLFSGDTLFAGSIGRMDLPGGDEEQMEASLHRLLELPDTTTVYPGHGPATSIGEERDSNPWLGGW